MRTFRHIRLVLMITKLCSGRLYASARYRVEGLRREENEGDGLYNWSPDAHRIHDRRVVITRVDLGRLGSENDVSIELQPQ